MNAPSQPLYTLHWLKKWDGALTPPDECPHPTTEGLTINQRLEPRKRGGHDIYLDAWICMNCGADLTGNLSLAEGLRRCMDEHGWNAETGRRLYALAEFNEDRLRADTADDDVWPIWFFSAWGWDSKQVIDALNAQAAEKAEQVPA